MPKDTSGLRRGGGRPKGVPNKTTVESREFADRILSDPAYVVSLRRRVLAGKAPHMETLLAQYRWGKPKDTVALEGPDGSPLALIRRIVVDVDGETS